MAANSNAYRRGAGLLLRCMAKSSLMSEQPQDNPGSAETDATDAADADSASDANSAERAPVPETAAQPLPKEIGGRKGPEPVRYGDWEKNGRCIDF